MKNLKMKYKNSVELKIEIKCRKEIYKIQQYSFPKIGALSLDFKSRI